MQGCIRIMKIEVSGGSGCERSADHLSVLRSGFAHRRHKLARHRHALHFLLLMLVFACEPISTRVAANETEGFQVKINAVAREFADMPGFTGLSPKDRQELAEFVTGNMLFVILHELGHTAMTEMGLPVLGRTEDAADSFATIGLIKIGSNFTDQVLSEAARGWFLDDRRDRATNETVAFYDEHGLDRQRAYQIVCLMVGSDENKFKDIATETKLPKERQDGCAGDYSNAVYSWDLVLKPHVRAPDQPETKIGVVYGEAKGPLAGIALAMRSIGLLDAVAKYTAEAFVWPAPFTLEMQSCRFPNARWYLPTHKLVVCYELAADFAELYRDYGVVRDKAAQWRARVRGGKCRWAPRDRRRGRGERG
jgi:hypothetical protein